MEPSCNNVLSYCRMGLSAIKPTGWPSNRDVGPRPSGKASGRALVWVLGRGYGLHSPTPHISSMLTDHKVGQELYWSCHTSSRRRRHLAGVAACISCSRSSSSGHSITSVHLYPRSSSWRRHPSLHQLLHGYVEPPVVWALLWSFRGLLCDR